MCQPCRRARARKVCVICGASYVPKTYSLAQRALQMTCSWECGKKYRFPTGSRTQERMCEVCGAGFRASYADQRTCGRTCGVKINRGYANRVRTKWPCSKISFGDCGRGGTLFVKRQGRQVFCGSECRVEARVESRRANKAWGNSPRRTLSVRPCERCSSVTIEYPRRLCDSCLSQSDRDRKKRGKRKRRAAQAGVATEPYTLLEIAARDRNRCGLCKRPVAMTKKAVPHPRAPTIDHVIPLSLGGDDIRTNVQLAHFICNSLKGAAGGGEQLALIG